MQLELSKQSGEYSYIGKPIERLEDFRIVRGTHGYTDDLSFADQHYAAILHSPYAHAKIKRIDVSKALQLPGVVYVLTGDEVKARTPPITPRSAQKAPKSHYLLAVDKVRYMGEPVAVVVAKDKYTAYDALDLIEVEYEPLPVVLDPIDALKPGSPLIYEELGTNELIYDKFEFGDVDGAFKKADVIVKDRFKSHRYLSGVPLEPYVVNAFYDKARDELTIYAPDQQPGRTLQTLERMLGVPASKIRIITPPAGGAFGQKLAIWQYMAIISLASIITGKPVKWVQTRRENLYGPHRPSSIMDAELALTKDGRILGMRLHEYLADGNFPYVAGLYALIKFGNMSGIYKIRNVSYEYHSVATNYPPIVQNSGVGKPFMNFVLERLIDIAARKLNIDPAEIRLRNAIDRSEMPYVTFSGEIYESGDFKKTLSTALEMVNYKQLRELQAKLRKEGRYIGIGIACGVEPGTSNLGYYSLSKPGEPDFVGSGQLATVEMLPGGSVKVFMNAPEIGTGHATTLAQVVSDSLGVNISTVQVDFFYDSTTGNLGYAGTYSNLFNDVCVGAVAKAAEILKQRLFKAASQELKVDVDDLEVKDGVVYSRSDPSKRISYKDLSYIMYNRLLKVPKGEDAGLRVTTSYLDPYAKWPNKKDFNIQLTHANSTHIAVVEVDPETYRVKVLDYVVVHDVGNVINPKIVEGLAIGSTLCGVAGAMYEEFKFDENGTNLSLTFEEYLVPTAMEAPEIKLGEIRSPAPNTVLGTKAVGEGGTITSGSAIASAVEDALSPFGVKITELPVLPDKLFNLVKGDA